MARRTSRLGVNVRQYRGSWLRLLSAPQKFDEALREGAKQDPDRIRESAADATAARLFRQSLSFLLESGVQAAPIEGKKSRLPPHSVRTFGRS